VVLTRKRRSDGSRLSQFRIEEGHPSKPQVGLIVRPPPQVEARNPRSGVLLPTRLTHALRILLRVDRVSERGNLIVRSHLASVRRRSDEGRLILGQRTASCGGHLSLDAGAALVAKFTDDSGIVIEEVSTEWST